LPHQKQIHADKLGLPEKGGAWLRRFDDVTGVEKLRCKRNKHKKAKEKYFIITNKYALPPHI